MKNIIIILLFLAFMSSCLNDSNLVAIDDKFKVGYINHTKNRDIYYNSQGIFKDEVIAVGWEDDVIYLKTRNLSEKRIGYYLLYKSKYIDDTSQLKSKGLWGPSDSLTFYNEMQNKNIIVKFKYSWD